MTQSTTTGGDECSVAGSVASLARIVEALDRRVTELSRLDKRVDTLADTLARVVMDVPGGRATGSRLPTTVSWLNCPTEPGRDPSDSRAAREASHLLDQLSDWVARVYLRYSDVRLPDCWLWHPDVVEELQWLHAAWKAAYHPDAPNHSVWDWHDRQRPGVVQRIKGYAGLCSVEAHLPHGEWHIPAPSAPTTDAVSAIAGWWATRRDGPGPVPTQHQLAAATERLRRTRR